MSCYLTVTFGSRFIYKAQLATLVSVLAAESEADSDYVCSLKALCGSSPGF